MVICREFIVSGKVHGVGYRIASVRRAQTLGLTGTVENLPNGTVRVVVEGPSDLVETMRSWCEGGPPFAHVTGVEVVEREPANMSGFRVLG